MSSHGARSVYSTLQYPDPSDHSLPSPFNDVSWGSIPRPYATVTKSFSELGTSKEVNPESSYVTTKKPDLFCPQFSRHLARVARGLWSPEEHEKAVAKRFEELQTASEALNTKPSRVKPVMIGRSRGWWPNRTKPFNTNVM